MKRYNRTLVRVVRVLSRASFVLVGLGVAVLSVYVPFQVPLWDKLLHFGAYAVWTFVSVLGIRRWPYALAVALAIVLAGSLVEVVQPFVGRSGDVLDGVANALGVLVGLSGAALARLLAYWVLIDRGEPSE